MISLAEIVNLWRERKSLRGQLLDGAQRVQEAYNGDTVVPLPEVDQNEKAAVANLLRQGLDGSAQRISSTMPDLHFAPDRPNIAGSVATSRDKRRAGLGWWEANDFDLLMGRRARHLLGYTQTPVLVRPDSARGIPRWEVRDPLQTFPAPPSHFEDMRPVDCIFNHRRPLSWLQRTYPDAVAILNTGHSSPDTLFDILQYTDEYEFVMGVVGCAPDPREPNTYYQAEYAELERTTNRAGLCPVVVPGLVTLDRLQSRYESMISMFLKKARLDALEYLAILEGVFPRTWAVSHPGTDVKIVTVADGREGVVGKVQGGTIISPPFNPGYKTDQALDRLEREMRLEGSVPAEFGGESATNVRTGRRGDAVLSAAIDFDIAENQRLLARSVQHEMEVAVEVAKGFFGNRQVSFYVDWRGAKGPVTYEANKLFDGQNQIKVRYAMAGADLNGQIVRIGQKLGTGLWSKQTAREMDPETVDPELEHDRVIAETLETAGIQGMAQQLASGSLDLTQAARVSAAVLTDKISWFDAVLKVHREMQVEQATSGPPGTPTGPVPPGAPEAQPGLSPPGAAEQAGVAIPPPGPSLDDLSQRLGQLRGVRSAISAARGT